MSETRRETWEKDGEKMVLSILFDPADALAASLEFQRMTLDAYRAGWRRSEKLSTETPPNINLEEKLK